MTEDTFDIRSEQQAPPSTDREFENALRPLSFDDFTGQTTGITVWFHQNKGVFQRGIQQVLTCNQNGIGAHKISFA